MTDEPKVQTARFKVVRQSTEEKPVIAEVEIGSVAYERMKGYPAEYIPLTPIPPEPTQPLIIEADKVDKVDKVNKEKVKK